MAIFSEKEVKDFFNKKWGDKSDSNISSMYLTKKVDLSLNSLLPQFLELTKPKNKIADLGCGDGRIVITLLKNNYKYICAIDYSKEAINRLNDLVKTENLDIVTKVEDLNNITLDNNKFDAIICTSVLHYFSDTQILELFKKIDLSLKPTGILYLTFESELNLETRDGDKFKFENQPERNVSNYQKMINKIFLKKGYKKKFSKIYKKIVSPTLPSFIAKKLKTRDKRYIRKMTMYEVILRKS